MEFIARMTQRFEKQMASPDSVTQNLEDWGLEDPLNCRDALRESLSVELEGFERLRDYIKVDPQGESRSASRQDFENATSRREKLQALLTMPLPDVVECLRAEPKGFQAIGYLTRRLEYYQSGVPSQDELSGDDSYAYSDQNSFSAEDIRTGLRRDTLLVAMRGTPELAAITLASRWCVEKGIPTVHMPRLTGYHSGVTSTSLGVYNDLFDIYHRATQIVGKEQGIDPTSPLVEHRAVLLMARWLTKAMEYNSPDRSSGSSYVSSLAESVAWAQLGEGVQRQLRGMRQKIQDVDLHNIKRFIGKSGDNRFERELKAIQRDLDLMQDESAGPEIRDAVLAKNTSHDLSTLRRRSAQDEQRLVSARERSLRQIEKLNLPADEAELQRASATREFDAKLSELRTLSNQRLTYLQSRSPQQLCSDLQAELESLAEKAEKYKSLAHKALELHFSDMGNAVDWINEARFGQISRAHHMLSQGVSSGVIIALTVDDWRTPLRELLGNSPDSSDLIVACEIQSAVRQLDLAQDSDQPYFDGSTFDESFKLWLDSFTGQYQDAPLLFDSSHMQVKDLTPDQLSEQLTYLLKQASQSHASRPNTKQEKRNENTYADDAIKLASWMKICGISVSSDAVRVAAQDLLRQTLAWGDWSAATMLGKAFSMPLDQESRQLARLLGSVQQAIARRDTMLITSLLARLKRSPAELLTYQTVKSQLWEQIDVCIQSGGFWELSKLRKVFDISIDEVRERGVHPPALRQAILVQLAGGVVNLERVRAISQYAKDPEQLFREVLKDLVGMSKFETASRLMEVIQLPPAERVEVWLEGVTVHLSRCSFASMTSSNELEHLADVRAILTHSSLTGTQLYSSTALQEDVIKVAKSLAQRGELRALEELKDIFSVSTEQLQASQGFQGATEDGVRRLLNTPVFENIQAFCAEVGMHEDVCQKVILTSFYESLLDGKCEHAKEIATVGALSSSDVNAAIGRAITASLNKLKFYSGSGEEALEFDALARVYPQEFAEAKRLALGSYQLEIALRESIQNANIPRIHMLASEFELSQSYLHSAARSDAMSNQGVSPDAALLGIAKALDGTSAELGGNEVSAIEELRNLFEVTEADIAESIEVSTAYHKLASKLLKQGRPAELLSMAAAVDYDLPTAIRGLTKVEASISYKECLIKGDFDSASLIRDRIYPEIIQVHSEIFEDEDIDVSLQVSAAQACGTCLDEGNVVRFIEIGRFAKISVATAPGLFSSALERLMKKRDLEAIRLWHKNFPIPTELLWGCLEKAVKETDFKERKNVAAWATDLLTEVRKLTSTDVPDKVKSAVQWCLAQRISSLCETELDLPHSLDEFNAILTELTALEAASQIDHCTFVSVEKRAILKAISNSLCCKAPIECCEAFKSWSEIPPKEFRHCALKAISTLTSDRIYDEEKDTYRRKISAIKALEELGDAEFSAAIGVGIVDHINSDMNAKGSLGAKPPYNQLLEDLGIARTDTTCLPKALHRICLNFEIAAIDDLFLFRDRDITYFNFVAATLDIEPLLTRDLIQVANALHLRWHEAEILLRNGIDLSGCLAKKDYKSIFDGLCAHVKEWQDAQNVAEPFKAGAEIFGYKSVLEYGSRKGLSRHDAYFAFNHIVALYEQSQLTPEQFAHAILRQVLQDNAGYREGKAHHHLNALAQSLGGRLLDTLEKAQRYSSIKKLAELAQHFSEPRTVFASWAMLKRFGELQQLLGRTEILKRLAALREAGTHSKLCDFVELLAFSESQVSTDLAIQFALEPDRFLDVGDVHSNSELHSRKKPSNYMHIPHLGLTAVELRDALVDGVLDRLQVFNALEIQYQLPRDGDMEKLKNSPAVSTRGLLQEALGSRKGGVQGKARNVKQLFHQCKQLLKLHNVEMPQYLEGQEISAEVEQSLKDLIHDPEIGMPKASASSRSDMVTVIAKINLKSDPDGVLAGNDTACCMPFGSGKNNIYTFNPNCTLFTVQVVNGDGRRRTIAQSVLTRDRDIEMPIPNVLSRLSSSGDLGDIIPQAILSKAPEYLACDNIEVAPNYKAGSWPLILELVYRDFFSEYMRRFAASQGLNPHVVPIGVGHSDALQHLEKLPNTFAPVAPVAYSDKAGPNVFALALSDIATIPHREIVEAQTEPKVEEQFSVTGISNLDFTDTLQVAYLESLVYKSNPSLITYLHNIENALIAKDISNTAKERPNLSIQYTDSQGQLKGYVLAYEGAYSTRDGSADLANGERVIYVLDIATQVDSKLAAGRLLTAFGELYSKSYAEKGDFVPIYAELREQTSYRLLKQKLEKLAQRFGCTVEMREFSTYSEGGETMYPVVLRLQPLQQVAPEPAKTL
jgi:hypothetical protein